MRKLPVLVILFALMLSCTPSEKKDGLSIRDLRKSEQTENTAIEQKIDELLSQMTLEEKIGQMTQINNSQIVTESSWGAGADLSIVTKVDTAKLGNLLRKYHIGSFLNGIAETPEVWYQFYKDLQEYNLQVSRLKIPIIYGVDQMHGPNYLAGGTIFPHAINTACTFNNEFPANMAHVTANEVADIGHLWIFAPVFDLGRTPLWGRFYETLGESPYQAATMGSIFTKALQSDTTIAPYKIAASAKHFFAYSDPKSGWDRTPTDLSTQTLYELHLPPFRAAVEAGIESVMINSGEINGEPVHASYWILTDILRNELKFKGVAVTDWEDIIRLYRNHRVAADEREATLMAINAGIDMAMTPYTTDFCEHMLALVREGKISEERIDLSVARILRMKLKIGLFENPLPRNDRFDRIGTSEHKQLALEAARESLVLMRNENNTLPLTNIKKLLVTGPVANLKAPLGGGWTLRWINHDESLYPQSMLTPFEALQKEFSESAIVLAETEADVKAKAQGADAIVVLAGENSYAEGFGSIDDINLPAEQTKWIQTAISTGKPVILVLISGRPRIITDVYEKTSAVIFAGWPGFEGAQAIAEVIKGKINPSGKLAFNYPYKPNRLLPHNHKPTEVLLAHEIPNPVALAHFGEGLSYTTYTYSSLTLSDSILRADEAEIKATVTVTNTGNREGKEAVLWFLFDEVASLTRPVRELKFYEKKSIRPGESVQYSFTIKPSEHLWFPDKDNNRVLENGYFTLSVGNLKTRFRLEK
ncbi:MAG: glycoside hydrolase family 3 C-terminal domain-containing protein [Cyclobacteriaceae bacterium]|nr:glycoside hydrolase family 3 C-terminal domain-containing protein [Cyclobacteriaceae bacterium]